MTVNQASSLSLPWIAVIVALLLPASSGLSVCEMCRPRELRNAPGVGIDLTMAYRTAAIHFKNGTTRDLIKIDGTQEYRSAMRMIADDAQNGNSTSWEWYRFISGKLHQLINPPAVPIAELPDDWVYAIAAMLSEIKSAALDTLVPPLKYNYVRLTWPDFEADTGHIYKGRFELACRVAGLEGIGQGNIASYYALQHEGTYESDQAAMLVISYNAASLGITLNTLVDGDADCPWPLRLVEDGDHAAEHALLQKDPAKYWHEVRDLLRTAIGNETVDCLLLLGSHARDPGLFRAVRDVLEGQPGINLSILDRYNPAIPHDSQDEDEPLFTVAREGSIVARYGMETGFYVCIELPSCIASDEEQDGHSEL
ncbi:uncharacterized protein CDV56_103778 [Aspergillus thermomutatus]|uniref:Uncharacterized protein n=1 Tax=Aspergillus thermomutatus TaxID=41047 RepID=A0A397G818_ASPTH|nr:uncharacterized protein CDV56_103778 [Aspergillus thermomutatus]RHZ46014.1 hypothetical protein CDV56_103778 [Aspergillus thermomutatus]